MRWKSLQVGLGCGIKKGFHVGEALSFNHLVEYRVEQPSQDHSFYYCMNREGGRFYRFCADNTNYTASQSNGV